MIQLLKGSRQKDMELQRTTVGVHRDDFIISLNDKLLKKSGSQGQKKTAIVALKLALYRYIFRQKDVLPLLLLDDVFDKLDGERMQNLLRCVDTDEFGQVILTDTESGRIEKSLHGADKKLNYIYLS
jgi:DNA replication and repair protein RecF